MGKLRELLSHLIRFAPEKKLGGGICTHPNLPEKQHYTKLVVNANDHCRTCEKHICLVCSEVHVQQHCELDRTPASIKSRSTQCQAKAH